MVTIRRQQASVQEQVTSPTPVQGMDQFRGGQALAQGLDALGDTAQVWQDEIDTADAKSADAAFTEKVNDLLYNEESGFMYAQGSAAINRRGEVETALSSAQEDILGKLSPAARRRAETAMTSRLQSATQRINGHYADARLGYLNRAAEARVSASLNSAIADPTQIDRQLGVAMSEIRDMGERMGWAPEVVAQKSAEARDQVYVATIERMSRVDPQGALDFARENRDRMTGSALSQVEQRLVPIAKERLGRSRARAALGGNLQAAFATARDALGMSEREQNAALAQYLSDGGQSLDPAKTAWCAAFINATLSRAGMGGTGSLAARSFLNWGEEVSDPQRGDVVVLSRGDPNGPYGHVGFFDGYNEDGTIRLLGGNQGDAVSVSSYDPGRVLGFRRAGRQSTESEVTAAMRAALDEPDPVVREAMLDEIQLRGAVMEREDKAAMSQAVQAGVALIESGGSVADLDPQTRITLGHQAMTTLRQYESSVRSGQRIETDSQTYVDLSRMAAERPQEFIDANPMEWRMKLDDADFERFVTMQAKMKLGGSDAEGARPVASSTLMSMASRQMQAAGFDTSPDPDSDEAKAVAKMQSNLIRWQTAYVGENGKAPTQQEIDQRIGRELTEVIVNPPGALNEYTGPSVGAPEVEPGDLGRTDITIGELQVPPAVILEQIQAMEAEGMAVTSDALIERIMDLLAEAGRL